MNKIYPQGQALHIKQRFIPLDLSDYSNYIILGGDIYMMYHKQLVTLLVVLSSLFLVACTSTVTKREIQLPEGIPNFVQESDFENIDWNKKAITFNHNIIGNENKSGVIGADMPSLNGQKWMWHLWGIDEPLNTKFTVVAFHKETETVHEILEFGWNIPLGGENNGADAHTPSYVKIPKPGEWAILLYIDEKLFDTLIYTINE